MARHTPKARKQKKASRKISKLRGEGVPQKEAVARGLASASLSRKKKKKRK